MHCLHGAPRDLCNSVAQFARRIATTYVDPAGLAAFIACRLVPLDKNPRVRPIGICETVRRIVGKAIMYIVGDDVQEAAGPLQLCAGQQAGCEAAVHALRSMFEDSANDGILFVDASNAFNRLNRAVALINIQRICPIISPILINTYRSEARLFVMGQVILSKEGTTQGDPLAMAMYTLAVVPLLHAIATQRALQVWFADDASAGGRLLALRSWWDALVILGPRYGYYPNAGKTRLVVKPDQSAEAESVFANTGVQITTEGRPCLGTPLGQPFFKKAFLERKVRSWVDEIERLATIAECHPQAAYCAVTHGLVGRWTYAVRTIREMSADIKPLENAIRSTLVPAMLSRVASTNTEWELLTLPTRLGGLGLHCLSRMAQREFDISVSVTTPLTSLVLEQKSSLGSASELRSSGSRLLLFVRRTPTSKLSPTASWSTCPLKVNELSNLPVRKAHHPGSMRCH